MDDLVLILGLLIIEFFGPVIVAGLIIWGLVAFFRAARLKKSFNASGDDKAALALERLRVKAGVVRFFALLGGAVGFYVGFSITDNIVFALLGMALGYAPLNSRAASMKQEYGKKFKESVVAPELAKTFNKLVYEPEGVFDADTLRDIRFFKPFSSVTGSDRITAEYKGIHFVQSDVTLLETGTGSGGQSALRPVSFFHGRVMRFDFAEPFSGPVQVVRQDFAEARITLDRGEWQPVETELAELGRDYRIFALDPLAAMKVLTPQLIEGIFFLDKTLRVPMAFYFTGNSMYAFMALTRDAFDVSKKKTLLEERQFVQKDVALVTDFLETMYVKAQEQTGETAPGAAENAPGVAGSAVSAASAAVKSVSAAPAPLPSASSSAAAPRRRAQERPVDLAAPTLADTARRAGYRLSFAANLLSTIALYTPLVFYLASAVYMLFVFPDGFALSYSSSGGIVTLGGEQSTLGYLLIGSIFIMPSSLAIGKAASDIISNVFRGGGSGRGVDVRVKSIWASVLGASMWALPFLLHLFYLSANVAYR